MSFCSSPVLLSAPSPAASFPASAPVGAPVSSSSLQFHCRPFLNNLSGLNMNSGAPFSFPTASHKRPRSDTPEASSTSFFAPQQKRLRQDFGDAVPSQPSTGSPARLWATDSADQNISMRRGVLPTATVGSGVVGASAPFAGARMTVESSTPSQALILSKRAGQKTKRGESIYDFSSDWTAAEAAQQLSSLTPEEEDLRAFYSTDRERLKRPVTSWTPSPSQSSSSAYERSLVCVPSSTPSGLWNEPQATPFSPSTLDNRLSVPWMEDTTRAIIPYSPATTPMPAQFPPCSPAYWRLKTTPSVTSIEEVLDEEEEDDTPTAMSL